MAPILRPHSEPRRRTGRPPVPILPAVLPVALAGRVVEVRLRVNARARRMTLRLPIGTAGPVITVPPRVSEAVVRGFLDSHREWLETRLARRPAATPFADGAEIPFRGTPHRIVHDGRLRGGVRTAAGQDGASLIVVSGEPSVLARRVSLFLRREAEAALKEAVHRHTAALGVTAAAVRIRDTTSRWGSCSCDRVLSFSWRVVMAPPFVLNYLVAHEVAHLREMNHSPAFWRIVARLDPQARQGRAWLKQHGPHLHAIGAQPDA